MKTKTAWRMALALGALAIGIRAAYAAGLPEPQKNEDLRREISTMARVLDDSIDRAGLGEGDWRGGGFGGWGSAVRGEFIPTVGALFTVRVNFPVLAPPEKSDESADSGKEEDLWDRHQRAADEPDVLFQRGPEPLEPERFEEELRSEIEREIETDIQKEMADLQLELADVGREIEMEMRKVDAEIHEGVAEGLGEAREAVQREFEKGEITGEERDRAIEGLRAAEERMHGARDRIRERFRGAGRRALDREIRIAPRIDLQMDFAPGMRFEKRLVSEPGGPVRARKLGDKYEEDKVLKLRATIIEALAKYGHRLEHLDPALKVMVRIEGPAAGREVTVRRRISSDGPDGGRAKEIEERIEEKIERRYGDRRVVIRKGAHPEPVRIGSPLIGRYVIAAKKADLTSAATAQDLETKIEEHRY